MMKIINFYRGETPNEFGYKFDDILAWSDLAWEASHSHIQWCFPTKEPSNFNPDAPLLTDDEITLFRTDPKLMIQVLEVFERAMRFYGIGTSAGEGLLEWLNEKPNWIKYFNHNFLRMTRILQSLRYLGYDNVSKGLFEFIGEHGKEVSPRAYEFWRNAAYGELP